MSREDRKTIACIHAHVDAINQRSKRDEMGVQVQVRVFHHSDACTNSGLSFSPESLGTRLGKVLGVGVQKCLYV